MRSIKTTGSLTRGRGMTELQRTEYLLSTPACAEVSHAMQDVTNVKYENSEQHKETTKERLIKDIPMQQLFTDIFQNEIHLMEMKAF